MSESNDPLVEGRKVGKRWCVKQCAHAAPRAVCVAAVRSAVVSPVYKPRLLNHVHTVELCFQILPRPFKTSTTPCTSASHASFRHATGGVWFQQVLDMNVEGARGRMFSGGRCVMQTRKRPHVMARRTRHKCMYSNKHKTNSACWREH